MIFTIFNFAMMNNTRQLLQMLQLDLWKNNRKIAAEFILKNEISFLDILNVLEDFPQKERLVLIVVLDDLVENNPTYIKPYLDELIAFCILQTHETAKRSCSRMQMLLLQKNKNWFDDQQKDKIIELHFDWLLNDSLVATKANCLSVLYTLKNHNEWLRTELMAAIEQLIPENTIAFKSRGEKILKKLKH